MAKGGQTDACSMKLVDRSFEDRDDGWKEQGRFK